MAWDANRPIPWRRLLKEATVFVVVGALAMAVLVKKQQASNYIGLVIGMFDLRRVHRSAVEVRLPATNDAQARERRQAMASAPRSPPRKRCGNDPHRRSAPAPGPRQRPNRSTKKRRR